MSSRLYSCRSVSRRMASKTAGSAWASGVLMLDPPAMASAMALDVVHDVLNRSDLLRFLVGDLHIVLFLERHHELDDVERIRAQVLDEGRLGRHLILAHAELLADDLLHPLLHARCHVHPPYGRALASALTCTDHRSRATPA